MENDNRPPGIPLSYETLQFASIVALSSGVLELGYGVINHPQIGILTIGMISAMLGGMGLLISGTEFHNKDH